MRPTFSRLAISRLLSPLAKRRLISALHALTVGGRHEADLMLWLAKCQASHARVGFRRKLDVYKEGLKTSLPFAARSLEAKYSMFGYDVVLLRRANLDEFA